MSTELDTLQSAELAGVLAQQDEEFDQSDYQTPILKIGQSLTREVQDGDAEPGDFIDTLTGESLGNKVDFIVAYYQRGRAARDKKTGDYYVAFETEIPERWALLVGEEFVGTPFTEYPDAEERFKERVNNKEIEWGHGPLISTTHNYTGLVVVPALDGSDEEDEIRPVRLTLKRTDVPAVRKINSLKKMKLRNKPFWDIAFELTTFRKDFKSGPSFLVNPKAGRATTAEEKAAAAELAIAAASGRVRETGGEEAPVEPDAKGGLGV